MTIPIALARKVTSTNTINQLIANLVLREKSGRSPTPGIPLADFLRCGNGRPPGPVQDASSAASSLELLYTDLVTKASKKRIITAHGYTTFAIERVSRALSFDNQGREGVSVTFMLI